MKIVLFYAILYIISFVYVQKYFSKIHGTINTFTIFGIAAFVYYLAIPIEVSFSNLNSMQVFGVGEVLITEGAINDLGLMSLFCLYGFSMGFRISGFVINHEHLGVSNNNSLFILKLFQMMALIFIVILVIFFQNELISSGSYDGNIAVVYNNPIYILMIDWVVLISILSGIINYKRLNLILVVALISVGLLWGIYASTKDEILLSFFGFIVLLIRANKIKGNFRLLLKIILSIILLPVFLIAFSIFRSGADISYEQLLFVLNSGVFVNTDPGGPFSVFTMVHQDLKDYYFGKTYTEALYMWIPKFIWRNRPLDLSEEFAQQNILNWSEGQGLGFSFQAEAYMNFGIWGGLIQFFLISLIWGLLWKFAFFVGNKSSKQFLASFYYVFGFYIIMMMHRSAFSGTTKFMVLFLLPVCIILFLLKISQKTPKRNESVIIT